nr:LysR family transcriptional regulator [Pseudomonas putida]
MQVFVRVAESGSFIQAAQTLSLPASTVTSSVKNLEKYLQVRLLNRTTRRVSLTPEGGAVSGAMPRNSCADRTYGNEPDGLSKTATGSFAGRYAGRYRTLHRHAEPARLLSALPRYLPDDRRQRSAG